MALPASKSRSDIGWPAVVLPKHIYRYEDLNEGGVPLETSFFHQRFNLTTWRNVMPRDTIYLAVMREPLYQLRSLIEFVPRLRNHIKGSTEEKIYNFFADPKAHHRRDPPVFSWTKSSVYSWTKSFMAYTLGFPQNAPMEVAESHLHDIDGVFDLVLLTEYLFESMVLLRRRMCWAMRDVVFIRLNSRFTETIQYPEELHNKSRAWNKVDHLYYDHFKQRLLREISYEEHFQEELQRFKEVNDIINIFCSEVTRTRFMDDTVVPKSDWNEEFRFTRRDCDTLATGNAKVVSKLKKQLDGIIDGDMARLVS
ncbi:galactose-3-O-sulfotransferase 2-like [Lineus longissimus]|uniref:galactose-3-O-sulfotransferase 2-like n=1 Tax=Lineus longissimus TaxID=88925 RepID=UPI00315CE972